MPRGGGCSGSTACTRRCSDWRTCSVRESAGCWSGGGSSPPPGPGSGGVLLGWPPPPPFPVLVALAAVVGVLYGPVGPLVNTAMQIRTPERLRGRVVGVMTSVAYAAGPAGYLVAGPLVEAFAPRGAFLAMASMLLAVVLVVMPTRALRELDAPEPCPPAPVRPVPVPGFPPGTPPPEGT